MNRPAYWVGVSSAFLAGVISGVVTVRVALEKKIRAEYDEAVEFNANSYQKALELALAKKEKPAANEIDLDKNLDEAIEDLEFEGEEGLLAQGGSIEEISGNVNPYHQAIQATETPIELFVDGGVNDYGVSYIEEEEYLDEDGRFKGKIDILMDEHNPIFIMDGQPIDDWDTRIGDSILVDFYKLVPPGVDNQVLYVRNHKTDEDYEVMRVAP